MNSRAAPGVRFALKRSLALLWVGVSTWVTSLLCLLAWTRLSGPVSWRQAIVGVACFAAGLVFAATWRAMLQGQLAWNGFLWTWERTPTNSHSIALVAKIDLQAWMLLQMCEMTGQSIGWTCVQRSDDPAHWLDFRRAVYSRRQHTPTLPDSPDSPDS